MIVVAIIGLLAALAVPNFTRAREQTELNGIINNLRVIEQTKEQWALENRKSTGDTATTDELAVYFHCDGTWAKPQANETYNINPLGTLASASGFKLLGKTQAFADGSSR